MQQAVVVGTERAVDKAERGEGEGGGRGKGGGGGQGGASSCVFLQGAEVEAAKLVAAKESIGDGF